MGMGGDGFGFGGAGGLLKIKKCFINSNQ